jgi:peptide/nickel transport system substrate-binding protein
VYYGMAEQMKSPYSPIYPFATQEYWNYETDLDRARQLLADGGYPNGFEMEVAVSTAFPELEQVAVLMQTNYAKIGVRMTINKMPDAVIQERTFKREFSSFMQWEQANCPDSAYSLYLYYHSKSFLDLANVKDPKLDSLIDQIGSSTDEAKREGWAKEAQQLLMQEIVPWVWLLHTGTHVAMRDNLSGISWETTNTFRLGDIKRS